MAGYKRLLDGKLAGINPRTTLSTFRNALDSIGENNIFAVDCNQNILGDNASDIIGTGATINLALNGYHDTYTTVVYGDVDGDGWIGVLDLAGMKRHLLRISTLSGAFETAGDIYEKGTISTSDLLSVKKHILGTSQIVQFPNP